MLAALGFLCLICCVSAIPFQQTEDGTVTVKIEDGVLRGKIATSIWNRTYHSFRAVPYAQPPVGDLRFKSPRPVKPWTGVRDALDKGTICPQSNMTRTNAKMSEDCLYLNVYVPQVAPSDLPTKGLSVLAFVHGGGFRQGTGNSDLYGPDNLMNLTAILVTLNYRLGALGFLSVEHPEVTSNAGMKDQVAALRWVKRNIAHFGGNPDDVTVFGQSAGGASVELLLLSNMTTGLFHRAISESGSAMMFHYNPTPTRGAFRLGEVLGHNATDADDLVKFLRSATAEDIVKGQDLARTEAAGDTVKLSTDPDIDSKVQEGTEVFLADDPVTLVRAGKAHPVPYITGINSKENKMVETGLTQEILDNYNKNPEVFVPQSLNLRTGSAESLELGEKIKSFYFGNKTISFDTLPQLVDLASDGYIYPSYRSAILHINYGSSPLYTYLFTYDGSLHVKPGNFTIKGPAHADDIAYLFYLSYKPYNPNSDDLVVIRHFTNMWVDYAQSGDPSVHESVKWIPATKTNHTYLQIDVDLSLHENMLKERMAFWDQVYNTYMK